MNINFLLFVLFFSKIFLSIQICEEGKNNCMKCDYRTKLCFKCEKAFLVPDDKGGCEGYKKCIIGNNYCLNCEENNYICKACEEGYLPDENGGCSNTNNCEISENGKCIRCKENFILTGDVNPFCKSINSEDLKNCEKFNQKFAIYEKCEENYFLNKGDHRDIEIENCYESAFGIC